VGTDARGHDSDLVSLPYDDEPPEPIEEFPVDDWEPEEEETQ
jgi:hypothetical protein